YRYWNPFQNIKIQDQNHRSLPLSNWKKQKRQNSISKLSSKIDTTNKDNDENISFSGQTTQEKTLGNPQTTYQQNSFRIITGLRKKDTVKENLHNSENWLRPAQNDKRRSEERRVGK